MEQSFHQQIRNLEAQLITKALQDADGQVTAASRALGFNHHQSLISLLNTRHKALLTVRKPIRPRRKHLINHGS